jgi:D-tagatose-1,6-bisphosphate aldolase subunit GatZ/KbaZ
MSVVRLAALAEDRRRGEAGGITSVCSAHPWVIETALGAAGQAPILIEATCNQVNQEGGYTGMTPAGFRRFVEEIADAAGVQSAQLILGGDHLGPNPWRHLAAEEAMRRAEAMVAAYVAAGFAKLHLDASMGCQGEPPAPGDEVVAARTARLAAVAEAAAAHRGGDPPVYVIGTEVPAPGGATHSLDAIQPTRPEAALATLAEHRRAFAKAGVGDVAARVVAVVVQPGVEFGNDRIACYRPDKARGLTAMLERRPSVVYEAHSTDYQPPELLRALVDDGFAILKVGPALTFALREALYGLDRIAAERDPAWSERSLEATMERLMLAEPAHWTHYYRGTPQEQRLLRHFSYSDRIRYYWPAPAARAAVEELIANLDGEPIAETLISQFLPRCYAAVRDHAVAAKPRALVSAAIRQALDPYIAATAERPTATAKLIGERR